MKTYATTLALLVTAACGAVETTAPIEQDTKPAANQFLLSSGAEAPAAPAVAQDGNSQDANTAADPNAQNPNDPNATPAGGWPTSGTVTCNTNVDGVMSGTYVLTIDANQAHWLTLNYTDLSNNAHVRMNAALPASNTDGSGTLGDAGHNTHFSMDFEAYQLTVTVTDSGTKHAYPILCTWSR